MTALQLRVLDYLRDFISRAGFSPSQREISADLGMGVNQVNGAIAALADAGYIRHDKNRKRAIELVDAADLRGASLDAIRAELARRGLSFDALVNAAPKALAKGSVSCAADSCATTVTVGHLFCLRHWRALPQHLRDAILDAFNASDRQRFQELVTEARDRIDAPRYQRVGGRW